MTRLVLGASPLLCIFTRASIGASLGAALALAACTTATVAEPSDAAAPGGRDPASLQADMIVDGPGAPTPTSAPAGAAPPPLAYNCQAPLMVIEEVTRLLTVAGTHATRSAACVDGPGHRVMLDEILVCPLAPDGTRRRFAVSYRVSTWDEGGRQVCAGTCPPVEPQRTVQRAELAFRSNAAGFVIEPPSALPGLPLDATPVTAAHDGDCYGKSEAFVPKPLALR